MAKSLKSFVTKLGEWCLVIGGWVKIIAIQYICSKFDDLNVFALVGFRRKTQTVFRFIVEIFAPRLVGASEIAHNLTADVQ